MTNIKFINNVLFLLLFLLNIVDFVTTKILVDIQGFIVEANPILYNLMVNFDTVWVILYIKLLILGLFFIFIQKSKDTFTLLPPKTLKWVLISLIAIIFIVSYNNLILVLLV